MKSWHDKTPAERMLSTRSALVTAQPFFGCIALSQKLVADESVGTAAVDGKSLFYAPSFVAKLSELECMGVYMHEIFHLVHMHHVRRNGREMADWNRACDFAINPAVIKAGATLPAGMLLDPAFAGLGSEEIYRTLQAAKPKPAEDGEDGEKTPQEASEDGEDNGEPQDGSEDGEDTGEPSNGPGEGNGENGENGESGTAPAGFDPGQCGGVIDAANNAAELAEAQAETEALVRQAVSVAKAANGGAVPEFLRELVSDLNRPRIDWREETREFINDTASRVTDWNRPNKRFLASPFILPGTAADSIARIALAVDVSGSIGRETLAEFQKLAQHLLDDGKVEALSVIYFHSAVSHVEEYTAGDTIKLSVRESGGTAFGPMLRHIENGYPDTAAIIVLTDLDPWGTDAWGEEPSAPVLWTVDGSKRYAPFGRVLPIDPYA